MDYFALQHKLKTPCHRPVHWWIPWPRTMRGHRFPPCPKPHARLGGPSVMLGGALDPRFPARPRLYSGCMRYRSPLRAVLVGLAFALSLIAQPVSSISAPVEGDGISAVCPHCAAGDERGDGQSTSACPGPCVTATIQAAAVVADPISGNGDRAIARQRATGLSTAPEPFPPKPPLN